MFTIEADKNKSTRARAGVLNTDHGEINTPIFMPVGTAATVKGVLQRDLVEEVNAEIILGNTSSLFASRNGCYARGRGASQIYGMGESYSYRFWRLPGIFVSSK